MILDIELWSLPAPGQPDHPALPVLDAVPAGHITHRMKFDMHAPRLCRDDLAVVDPNNRTFTNGALFLIDFTGQTQIVAAPPEHHGPPRLVSKREDRYREVGSLYSGDTVPPQLAAMIHGRVVGVLRQTRPPENRAAGDSPSP